jgi:hypothetical protein
MAILAFLVSVTLVAAALGISVQPADGHSSASSAGLALGGPATAGRQAWQGL